MAGTADEKSTSKRWNWRIPVPERFRRSAAANPKGTATGEGAGGRSRSGEAAAPRTPRKSIREQFAASKGMAWKFAAATALLSVLLVVYHSFRGPRHHRHSPVDQQGVANNDQGAEVKIVHAGDSPDSHALDSHSTSSGGADPAAAPPQSADQATVAASDPMSLPADKNSAPSDPSHAEPFHRHHSGGHDAKKGDDAPVLTTSNDPPLQNDPLSQSPSGAGSGASGAGSLTNNSSTPFSSTPNSNAPSGDAPLPALNDAPADSGGPKTSTQSGSVAAFGTPTGDKGPAFSGSASDSRAPLTSSLDSSGSTSSTMGSSTTTGLDGTPKHDKQYKRAPHHYPVSSDPLAGDKPLPTASDPFTDKPSTSLPDSNPKTAGLDKGPDPGATTSDSFSSDRPKSSSRSSDLGSSKRDDFARDSTGGPSSSSDPLAPRQPSTLDRPAIKTGDDPLSSPSGDAPVKKEPPTERLTDDPSAPFGSESKPIANDKPPADDKPLGTDKPLSIDKPIGGDKPPVDAKPLGSDRPSISDKLPVGDKSFDRDKPLDGGKPLPPASSSDPLAPQSDRLAPPTDHLAPKSDSAKSDPFAGGDAAPKLDAGQKSDPPIDGVKKESHRKHREPAADNATDFALPATPKSEPSLPPAIKDNPPSIDGPKTTDDKGAPSKPSAGSPLDHGPSSSKFDSGLPDPGSTLPALESPKPIVDDTAQQANVSFSHRPPEKVGFSGSLAYRIVVRNNGSKPVKVVEVEEAVGPDQLVQSTDPPADSRDSGLHWSLHDIAPHAEQTITITLAAAAPLPVEHSLPESKSHVQERHEVRAVAARTVVSGDSSPIQLEVIAPPAVRVGQPCRVGFRAGNAGPKSAVLKLNLDLPAALQFRRGQRLEYQVGTLDDRESREDYLTVMPTTPGTFEIQGELVSGTRRVASARFKVRVASASQSTAAPNAGSGVYPAGGASVAWPPGDCNCWP